MSILKGVPASPGYARGSVFLYRPPDVITTPAGCIMPEAAITEKNRFNDAVRMAVSQLETVQEQVRLRMGNESAAIFDAHVGLLHDPMFVEQVLHQIQDNHLTAEYAVALEIQSLEKTFAAMASDYLRDRAHDVRDIGNRIVRNLLGDLSPPFARLPKGSVIVAASLTPTDTIQLNPKRVAAIITEIGGRNSHAAILSRSLGIPAVSGLHGALARLQHGRRILVDGTRGTITTDATESAIRQFSRKANNFEKTLASTKSAETGECITKDGVRIRLYGNVSQHSDSQKVSQYELDGIGLVRTELLFSTSTNPPPLGRQTSAYSRIAQSANGQPAIARTFDFGEDKLPAFLHAGEANRHAIPFRGLRYALAQGGLMRTQLRALVRASAKHPNLRILFPMVIGHTELAEATQLLSDLAQLEGVERPRVGAMIETPAAIFALPTILELVDFVSIGTNDLGQYLFATNRQALDTLETGFALKPAMLEALYQIAAGCRRFNRPACVCGEIAGDPFTAALLVGMGFRSLSMSPSRAPAVRLALRHLNTESLSDTLNACRTALSAAEVERILYDSLPRKVQEISRALHTPV